MNLRKQTSNLRIHQLQSLQNEIASFKMQNRSKSRLTQKISELRLLADSANDKFVKLKSETVQSRQVLSSQAQSLRRALQDKQNQYQIKSRQNRRLSEQSAIQQIQQRMLLMQLNGQKQLYSQSIKECGQSQRQLQHTRSMLRQHQALCNNLSIKVRQQQEHLSATLEKLKRTKENSDILQEELSLCEFRVQIEKQELSRLQQLQTLKLSNYAIQRLSFQVSMLQQVLRENRKDQYNINFLITNVQQESRQLYLKHSEAIINSEEFQRKSILVASSLQSMKSAIQNYQKQINQSKLKRSRLLTHIAKLREQNQTMRVKLKGYKSIDSTIKEILASRLNKQF